MPTTKKPQDRKPKKDTWFIFDAAGEVFTLPPATDGLAGISGRVMRDAMMSGDEGEVRLGFALLEACGAEPEAIEALYDKPALEMVKVLAAWMQHSEVTAGATLGESPRSST